MAAHLGDDGEFDFLPAVYDIIKSIEKEQTDNAQKLKDSQEASQRVLELQRKLEHAREIVRRLPGIDLSRDEQYQQIDLLRKQLALKKELLAKHRVFSVLDRDSQI